MRTRIAFSAILIVAVARVGAAQDVAAAQVEVRVPFAPIAVMAADGATHIAYELHITNIPWDTGVLRLDRLEVFGDPNRSPLVTYDAVEIDGRIMHADVKPGAELRRDRAIGPGRRAIVHVWISTSTAAPRSLRDLTHRLVFLDDKGAEQLVDDVSVGVRSTPPAVLRPPLRGEQWLVHNGPGNHQSPHWGSVVAWNGRTTIPQRFAADFLGLDANGKAVRGDFRTSANEDWTGFGAEVLAVADGVVVDMHDGVSDNAPLVEPPPPATLTPTALYGNYVVLDLGSNTFAHYAHPQKNSVTVSVGQRVGRGDVLGHLGNSGNTNAPHLHFHVSDSASFGGSEGIPFVIDAFELIGTTTAERAVAGGAKSDMATTGVQTRPRQLPLDGMVVRFR